MAGSTSDRKKWPAYGNLATAYQTLAKETAFAFDNQMPVDWPYFITWQTGAGLQEPWFIASHAARNIVAEFTVDEIDLMRKETDRLNKEYWEKQ
jgi:hypothetical protein